MRELALLILPFLLEAQDWPETEEQETNSDSADGATETEDASIVTTAVVLFSIVFLGFLWLFYENNRKVKVQNRALDLKTDRSRASFGASLASNSFTAIPMASQNEKGGHTHELKLASGDSEFSVGNRPDSFSPDLEEKKRRYTPSGMAGAFIDESELNKRDTLTGPSQSTINALRNKQSSVIELEELDDDFAAETPAIVPVRAEEILCKNEDPPKNSVKLLVEDDNVDEKTTGGSEVDEPELETQPSPLPVEASPLPVELVNKEEDFQKLDTKETFAALKGLEAEDSPALFETEKVLDADDDEEAKRERFVERASMRL